MYNECYEHLNIKLPTPSKKAKKIAKQIIEEYELYEDTGHFRFWLTLPTLSSDYMAIAVFAQVMIEEHGAEDMTDVMRYLRNDVPIFFFGLK